MDGLANDINVVQVFVMIFVKSRTADDLFVVAAAKQNNAANSMSFGTSL
jgi:hypothetical protein